MRITTGFLKGRIINLPKQLENKVRPTSEKVRKAIFDKLQFFVEDSFVLDLFCGSGSFGIEALSRGASYCAFVDNDDFVIDTLSKNLELLNVMQKSFLLILDDLQKTNFVKKLYDKKFDIVFMGPPYKIDKSIINNLVNVIISNKLVKNKSLIIIESSFRSPFNVELDCNNIEERRYGDTLVNFYFIG